MSFCALYCFLTVQYCAYSCVREDTNSHLLNFLLPVGQVPAQASEVVQLPLIIVVTRLHVSLVGELRRFVRLDLLNLSLRRRHRSSVLHVILRFYPPHRIPRANRSVPR